MSLHRSKIFRALGPMQVVAAELAGCAGKFRCFLARNDLVASVLA